MVKKTVGMAGDEPPVSMENVLAAALRFSRVNRTFLA